VLNISAVLMNWITITYKKKKLLSNPIKSGGLGVSLVYPLYIWLRFAFFYKILLLIKKKKEI